jgi:TRAP-type mannitol/chloroaromatic compound transport system permease large subunit
MSNITLPESIDRMIEVGIFAEVEQAESAVKQLLAGGFDKQHVTVVCSDDHKERYFRDFEHQDPAGTFAPQAALTGAVIGALLGGVPVIGAAVATGSVLLWVAGPAAAGALGIAGGLVGAMATRGIEKELANYYQQAVIKGAILVAAEASGSNQKQQMVAAAQIFSDLGAKPLPLAEG